MDTQIQIDTAAWIPDQVIPSLKPYGLERVPGWRPLPGVEIPRGWRPTPGQPGYEDPTWRADHKAWACELRDVVRPWIHAQGNADPAFAALERDLVAQDFNYFGAVYGWIQDPQPIAGEEQDKPYAKFAYQCHNTAVMADWTFRDRSEKAVIWRSKSRQLGISWDDEHFDTAFWLTQLGRVKLFSRSELWVYNGLSTEAMFGKIFYILGKIAQFTPYLLPRGTTIERLQTSPLWRNLVLTHPVTRCQLTGESTTAKVGRGGTYTYGRGDEDAFIRDLNNLLTSIRPACPRVFLASTESFEVSTEHFEGWQSAKRERPETVLEYNWHQNPYLDLAWERAVLAACTNEAQRAGVLREVFRDPFAGASTFVYPEARDIPERHRPYRPEEPLDITLDPAGAGDDFGVLACQPTNDGGQQGFHVLWSYEERLPNPERIAHILTGIWPEPGDSCYGWTPDATAQEVGAFLYRVWRDGHQTRWFMDPAGDQVHGSRDSFYVMFTELTERLRRREVARLTAESIDREERGESPLPLPVAQGIAPLFLALQQHRYHGDREFAFRKQLPFITVQSGVRSALRARECFSNLSYNELNPRAVTEPRRKHDGYSHLGSCGEYYAVYALYGYADGLTASLAKVQQKMAGLRGPQGRAGRAANYQPRAIPTGFHTRRGLAPHPTPGLPADRVSQGSWR